MAQWHLFVWGAAFFAAAWALYRLSLKRGWIQESANPFNGKKRSLFFEFFRLFAIFAGGAALIWRAPYLGALIWALGAPAAFSLARESKKASEERTIALWEYGEEEKKAWAEAFSKAKAGGWRFGRPKAKIAMTERALYLSPRRKLSLSPKRWDNFELSGIEERSGFLVFGYAVMGVPVFSVWVWIPKGKTKEAREIAKLLPKKAR